MSQQNENGNSDTTNTKIYVGGLPWATRKEGLRRFFEQFGEIIRVNVVCERQTGRSKGYGFVTFKDAESATRACVNQSPTIEGRIANCKLASSSDNKSTQTAGYRPDDLCFLVPSLWQNQQQPTYVGHPWNQNYPCYYPQQSFHYDPQYYSQFYPQCDSESYQFSPMVNTRPTYWPHQYPNDCSGDLVQFEGYGYSDSK